MNDVCVFTTTHGKDRLELFSWKNKDENLKWFSKQFHTIIQFHNSPKSYVNSVLETCPIYDTVLEYNDMNYPKALLLSLSHIKEQGFKKFIFLMDDFFSSNRNRKYYELLADFIKNEDFDHINFEYTMPYKTKFSVRELSDELFLCNNTNYDLKHTYSHIPEFYFLDDTPYACSVDFMKTIYNEEYFNQENIWNGEAYKNKTFSKLPPIPRNCFNIQLFRNTNIIGANNWNEANERNWLDRTFNHNEQIKCVNDPWIRPGEEE